MELSAIVNALTPICLLLFSALYWYQMRQRKWQEALLLKAKEEVRDIAQLPLNNPHPLIQINDSGEVIFANLAAIRTFPDLNEKAGHHPVLAGSLCAGTREVSFHQKIYHQTILANEGNEGKSFVIYFHDITPMKEYEKKIKSAYHESDLARISAEQAKEARGDFLANMSHELRTPMNGIIGLSDLLVEGGLPGEKQELIEAVNSSAKNLLILLNDILDFSKIEAGELVIESMPFDIRKTIKQIDILQQPVARKKNIQLHCRAADHIPQFLFGDAPRLQQVMNNLISNALKFTHEGQVLLSLSGQDNGQGQFELSLAVIDTGIGIPLDKQGAIFEKFQQADTSTSRIYGGTGLGLSITKQLTELMGGTISLKSKEGVGTTFTLSIPMKIYNDEKMPDSHTKGQGENTLMNVSSKILIVDDHPVNLLYMRKTLRNLGFNSVDEALSGVQAIELFKKNKDYDLVLMDCQMPEMSGYEASENIRKLIIDENITNPVIIAVTADAMQGAKEKCLQAGMNDYITKPIDKNALKKLLADWLPEVAINKNVDEFSNDNMAHNLKSDDISIFDWSRLREFTDGDQEEENAIIKIFIDALVTDLQHLQASFDQKDFKEWDSWVHKLYGACSHIGANSMAIACDKGQTLFPDQTEKIPVMHEAILSEYKRVYKALKH